MAVKRNFVKEFGATSRTVREQERRKKGKMKKVFQYSEFFAILRASLADFNVEIIPAARTHALKAGE